VTREQLEHAIRAACAVREKDRDFVRVLLTEGMIDAQILKERVRLLKTDKERRDRLIQWVQSTAEEL
jgi:hypothetical protein